MVARRLFSSFVRQNEELNSIRFPSAKEDPWQPYRALVQENMRGASVVVDLGAGAVDASKEWLSNGGGRPETEARIVVSVDQDWPSLEKNTGRYRVVADVGRLPFREDSVDLILSRYTLEHLRNPWAMIKEVARVLRPGKALVFFTPHQWCYVSLVSRLTPLWFHRLVYKLLGHSDDNLPFCPTYYRLNTPGKIRGRTKEAGLRVKQLKVLVGAPEYTKIFPPFFHRFFIWFHTVLERSPRLRDHFGVNVFGVLEKSPIGPGLPSDSGRASG